MSLKGYIAIFMLLVLPGLKAFSQIRCYSDQMHQAIPHESEMEFEGWIAEKISQQRFQQLLRTEAVVQIPVVVHILHNGETYGTGKNITDEQILSQIQVLNEDFRRTNPDAVNTPSEFLAVAADVEIEFVLAKQDPEGLPTNGIVRKDAGKDQWQWAEQTIMKNMSFWPTDDYLNIWVTDLTLDGVNLLGYATYPVSALPGIPFGTSPNNDGLAIDFTVFGSIDYYPQGTYNVNFIKGRTTTHEMGHFLGLRHIWGDSNCGNDFCDDTPTQQTDTGGCPSGIRNSCGSNDMYMNYMDYTNDECMNIFTGDQKDRMIAVLNNSPRRLSLLTSHALTDPVIVSNDAGFTQIVSPGPLACSGTVIPEVELRNYGNNTINSIELELYIDGLIEEILTFTPTLDPLDKYIATFSSVPAISGEYSFLISSVNGGADGNTYSNQISINTAVPSSVSAPFIEDFESGINGWTIINEDNEIGWVNTTAASTLPNNRAMRVEFSTYDNVGELEYLISPVFDLSTADSPFLNFDVAYRNYFEANLESLLVAVIPNCQLDVSTPMSLMFDSIYYKAGADLATVSSSGGYFNPSGPADWRTEAFISLDDYKGLSQVQLVFVASNGFGNNMYLDNIQVSTESNLDIAVERVVAPGRLSCETVINPIVLISNTGSDPISSFQIQYDINGSSPVLLNYSGFTLNTGQSLEALLGDLNLGDGQYALNIRINSTNGGSDAFSGNNTLSYAFDIDSEIYSPPDRENFDDEINTWTSFAEEASLLWTPFQESIRLRSYNNFSLGEESWLISPAYDFSNLEEASLFFDVAYSKLAAGSESLYLIASRSCGTEFDEIFYLKSGDNLATAAAVTDFVPNDSDWRNEFVNLSDLAGESKVRLAFLAVNGGGNNLYLDQFELFVDDDPDPLRSDDDITLLYPNPTNSGKAKLTFNLAQKQDVSIRVFNTQGKEVFVGELTSTLNQTVELDLSRESQGIYIVEIIADTFKKSYRLMNIH